MWDAFKGVARALTEFHLSLYKKNLIRDKACALSPTRGHSNSYTCQTLSQNYPLSYCYVVLNHNLRRVCGVFLAQKKLKLLFNFT